MLCIVAIPYHKVQVNTRSKVVAIATYTIILNIKHVHSESGMISPISLSLKLL